MLSENGNMQAICEEVGGGEMSGKYAPEITELEIGGNSTATNTEGILKLREEHIKTNFHTNGNIETEDILSIHDNYTSEKRNIRQAKQFAKSKKDIASIYLLM